MDAKGFAAELCVMRWSWPVHLKPTGLVSYTGTAPESL